MTISAFRTKTTLVQKFLFSIFALLLLAGCETHNVIVNDVEEREANEIIVFLASKGIEASKTLSPTAGGAAVEAGAAVMWSIAVNENQMTEAMAILNQNGLPRKKGVSLLEIFAKSGLVSSEREENIRYQAGLAEQIAGTIRKIDGVIDADVQISIPTEETLIPGAAGAAPSKRITASVYVKHQGILDDPNSHLMTKIKRLVAASIAGLDINDVTVISDRSRFTDISLEEKPEDLTPKTKEYVSIWSIVMNKASAGRFRFLFFILIISMISFALLIAWLIWKFYPILRRRGGFRKLFHPSPFQNKDEESEK